LAAEAVEIVVTVAGLDETMSRAIHACTSYRAHDLLCHRFADVFTQSKDGCLSTIAGSTAPNPLNRRPTEHHPAGVPRYNIRLSDKIVWADRPEASMQHMMGPVDLLLCPPGVDPPRPISVTFVPAKEFENPPLLQVNPEYHAVPPILRIGSFRVYRRRAFAGHPSAMH
jgi:hypothetical protein